MKKNKKLIVIIVIGVFEVALGFFSYLSQNIEGRYRVGVWFGFITDDTSLYEAAGGGQKDKVEELVAGGFDINARNRWGQTPLYISTGTTSTDVAEILIANGADVNAKCKSQWMQGWWWKNRSWKAGELEWTPLHAAVNRGNRGVAELLLANGANVNARDENGETPLHKMVRREVAELLISNGADVNAKDKDGMAVLDYAVMTELVELLIAKGAEHTILSVAYMGDLTKLKALIEDGVDVNARDKFGQTALHLAAFAGHKMVVELLLANGARVDDMENNIKLTPLHMAALTGHLDVAELLITNGTNINTAKGILDWTPLLLAINNGHKGMVELLLKNGADVNSTSRRLPKSWTFYLGKEDNGLGVWLWIPVTSPISVTNVGPIPKVLAEQLIFKGPDIETGYKWLIYPLWIATHTGNVEIVDLLKEYQAIELSLHQAAAEGNIEQVRLHISHGADLNAKYRIRTPLSYARGNGHTEIVELLKQHGATE